MLGGPEESAGASACVPPGWGARSSSMGNASTSVGPSSSIHSSWSLAMAGSSTSSTDSSASECTPRSSSTYLARRDSPASSTATPDSLTTSTLMPPRRARPPSRASPAPPRSPVPAALAPGPSAGQPGRRAGRVIARVGVHNPRDQLVADHVVRGELAEVDVGHVLKHLLDHPQPADLPGRQVHLGHVTGHDDPGAEPQPGEEHLHLLGRGVLCLVQDDERVVQGPAA